MTRACVRVRYFLLLLSLLIRGALNSLTCPHPRLKKIESKKSDAVGALLERLRISTNKAISENETVDANVSFLVSLL